MPGHDLPAVIHVHTRHSDGTARIPELVQIAQRQGIRVLYVTDHNTMDGQTDNKQELRGDTLVLVGTELSTRSGHLLALGVSTPIEPKQPTATVLAEVERQGGLSLPSHPHWPKQPWSDWSLEPIHGIELYNLAADAYEESRLKLLLTAGPLPVTLFFPLILDRPDQTLTQWDTMTQQRRMIGIAGNDAHGLRWTPLIRFAPYDLAFACVRTHLIASELSAPAVHTALAAGHAFIGFDILGDTSGFTFLLLDGDRVAGFMGDEAPMRDHLSLFIWTPRHSKIHLLRNGQRLTTAEHHELQIPITEPGVYRIEAFLNGEPWIISNPIYVREQP